MNGYAKLKVIEHDGGFAVVEDVFLGQVICKVMCASRTKDEDKRIADLICGLLNKEG